MNAPYRARRPAELVAGAFFLDLGGDHRDATFVAGSGRSGTTWLSSLINHDNRYRFIFEPFHPAKVAPCDGFLRKQYLRPEDGREMHLDAAGKILSGKVRSRWADRFNRKLVSRKRLVKDIRANLLLGWLRFNFPEMPTVLILRHPCAVADSRLRLGWRDNLDEIMSQKQLVEDHLKPFEPDILAAKDPFERSIFLWCIENYVPLRQPGAEKLHVVFYENLLANPEKELAPLFAFLGGKKREPRTAAETTHRPVPPRTRHRRDDPAGRLRTGADSPGDENDMRSLSTVSDTRRISGWTERVGEAERKKAAGILRLFGLDRIYGEDPMPRPEEIFETSERK